MSVPEENRTYDLAKLVRLTDEQISSLLQSGCSPSFRSLGGILQDAACMGALELHKALKEGPSDYNQPLVTIRDRPRG